MNLEQNLLKETSNEINTNQSINQNNQNTTNSFNNSLKINLNNNNNTMNQTQPNQEKTFYNKDVNLTEENIKNKEHPLVFYALGKLNNYKIDNNTIPLYTSQGFRSSSNDVIKRNLFSIHTSYFDELRKKKENSTINNQITEENDYLNPIKIYKSFHKYNINNNCINQETYNLAKKKMYSKDIVSNIKKGLFITKKDFIEQKNKALSEKQSKIIDLKEKRYDLKLKHSFDNTKKDKNDYLNKTVNTERINNKFIFKDPNDHTKEELKSKDWRFDRNYKMFIKHKNWWKPDKYVTINY